MLHVHVLDITSGTDGRRQYSFFLLPSSWVKLISCNAFFYELLPLSQCASVSHRKWVQSAAAFLSLMSPAEGQRRMAQVESFERRKCFVCAGNELQRSPPHEKVLFFAFLNEVSEEMMSVEDSSERRRLRSLKLFEGAVGRVSEPAQLAHCQGRSSSRRGRGTLSSSAEAHSSLGL